METIEEDYETLAGLLPKQEYEELDDDALRQVLRIFNDPALQKADGDVFGRIEDIRSGLIRRSETFLGPI